MHDRQCIVKISVRCIPDNPHTRWLGSNQRRTPSSRAFTARTRERQHIQGPDIYVLRPTHWNLCVSNCTITRLNEPMHLVCIACLPQLIEEILIVDHSAQPRENSQMLVIAGGTDEKENVRQSAMRSECDT